MLKDYWLSTMVWAMLLLNMAGKLICITRHLKGTTNSYMLRVVN